jgi:subtilisin family serine protease
MPTIVIPCRPLQWLISLANIESGVSTFSALSGVPGLAGLDLNPSAWMQLKLVGGWLTENPSPLLELERQGLVTLVPGDLPLTFGTGGTASAPPSVPWHLRKVGLDHEPTRLAGGAGIRVGIIDTGVDASEAEVMGKVDYWATCDDTGAHEQVPPVPSADYDPGRHGTKVASLIVGKTLGVAPAATLAVAALCYPTKKLPAIALFHALEWLRGNDSTGKRRADVINVSLHCDPCATDLTGLFFQAVDDLIVTAAIGQYATADICSYPGSSRGVVGVGALDDKDGWAGSSWGFGDPFPMFNPSSIKYLPKPELHAPGFKVRVAGGVGDGSSFASAIVAGVAAVLLSRHSSLKGPKKGEDARNALFAATKCLRLYNRITPGAWSPWLGH